MLIATARDVGRIRAFVQEHAARTAAGRRWLARAAPHWPELIGRVTTSPVLQAPVIDERTLVAGHRLLAALEARASATLRRTLAEFRRDLEEMRGRRLAEVLGPRETPERDARAREPIMNDEAYMDLAIAKAREGIAAGQIPVGALLVRDGAIVSAVHNTVWRDLDPTAHGEMNAVRHAATALRTVDLTGSTVYVTLEPCPMCLGAMHWARIGRVVYGASIAAAAAVGFSELTIPAAELARLGGSPLRVDAGPRRQECLALFEEWRQSGKARTY